MAGYDVCIVGCGLLGLAVGRSLVTTHPGLSLVLVDKEDQVGVHQSGHNSGVIHSGLYYKPGSLKARLAVTGAKEMYRLCEETGVTHRRTGKVVIATHESELPALDELERRGNANGLSGLRRLGGQGIADFEPAAKGIDALHVPEAGVADYAEVARVMADHLRAAGAEIRLDQPVTKIANRADGVDVVVGDSAVSAKALVNCGGLHSDRIASLAGIEPTVRIIPFRGEYYTLSDEKAPLVRSLVYPVPDPRFPFLGVHFTRRFDDTVEVGPNALLALGREQYRGHGPDWGDFGDILSWPGFWRLARHHVGSGARELLNSRSRSRYAGLARRLIPGVEAEDLRPGGAGVRAQAVDRQGRLVDDFVIESTGASIHVLNAPSPGATASLAIGREVANRVVPLLGT